jgi:hypothetical protein
MAELPKDDINGRLGFFCVISLTEKGGITI